MERRLYKTFFYLLLFLSIPAFSQEDEYIIGKLLDAKTEEPIAFASIRIKAKALGIISNVDGSFKIPLKFKEYGDVLEISSMGYKVLEIELISLNLSQLNILKLEPNIELLDEVVLISKKKKALKAEDIVFRAIQNIPQNYPVIPFSYIGYYRDFQVKNEKRFNFNEAIIEVFDNGFATNDYERTNYKLYHYSINNIFPRDPAGEKPYDNKNKFIPGAVVQSRKGNELMILRNMDAIRNYQVDTYSYVYQFEKDFLKNHWFRKNQDISLGDVRLYSIRFSKRTDKYLVFGEILISKTSFAIYKFDYEVYARGDGISTNSTYVKLKRETTPLFTTRVGYNEFNGMMYPSYISFDNQFTAYGEPKFRAEKVSLDVPEKCVVVNFNRTPNQKEGLKASRYNLKYRNQTLKIKYIVLDGSSARIYLSKQNWQKLEIMVIADRANEEYKTSNLNLVVTRMKDLDGNIINEPTEIRFNQFRELFIQRINPVSRLGHDARYMRKDRPIFENQIFDIPDDFSDYWMNTPFKKVNEKNQQ